MNIAQFLFNLVSSVVHILFYTVVLLLPHLEKGGCHSFLRNTYVLAHAHDACPSACVVRNKNVCYVVYLNYNMLSEAG